MPTLRKTEHVKRVLGVLLEQPETERYALELFGLTGLYPAGVGDVLARLARQGWLERRDEEGDPAKLGRPLRIYYRPLPEKLAEAREWLRRAGPLLAFPPVDLGDPTGSGQEPSAVSGSATDGEPPAIDRTATASVSRSEGLR